jgi:hypothetical protein
MKTWVNFLTASVMLISSIRCGEVLAPHGKDSVAKEEVIDYHLSHAYRARIVGKKDDQWAVYVFGKLASDYNNFLAPQRVRTVTCLGIEF